MAKNILYIIIAILILQITFSSCSNSNSADEVDMELIPVQMGGKCGYVDHKGKFVINPQFKHASAFHDGLALVYTFDDKAGYINKEGKFTIPAVYAHGTHFCNGMAFVVSECSTPICIDVNGKELFHTTEDILETERFSQEGLARFVAMDDISGFMDKSGKITIPAQYTTTQNPHEGLILVRSDNGEYGFVNTQGQDVINPQFDGAMLFQEGLAAVKIGKQWGYIDHKGSIVINPQFDAVQPFKNGLASVRQGSMWGAINKEGVFIINPQFDDLGVFSKNGLAYFKQNGQYGYVDKKGKIVINPQFDYASDFYGDIAFVEFDQKCGAIDESGKYVINPQFDAIGNHNFAKAAYIGGKNIGMSVSSTTCFDSPILDYILEKNKWLNDTYENTIGQTAEMGEFNEDVYEESGIIVQAPTVKDNLSELSIRYLFDRNLYSGRTSQAKLVDYMLTCTCTRFKTTVMSNAKIQKEYFYFTDKVVKTIERTENVKFTEWNGLLLAEKGSTAFFLFRYENRSGDDTIVNVTTNFIVAQGNEVENFKRYILDIHRKKNTK